MQTNIHLILSISAFVLNSILISGFIIPQVQKLKEIKDQLLRFKLTYVSDSKPISKEKNSLGEKQKKDINKLQNILDTYRIRSNELKNLVRIFYFAIGIVMAAIISILIFQSMSNIILISHALSQIIIFILAIKTYAVSPDRLQEADYLIKELDINPHALINALDLNLFIESGKDVFPMIHREYPLKINLTYKIRVWGFRFLFLVSGTNNEVYFLSFGPINSKTPSWRVLVPPDKFGGTEYNWIEIGSFPFNLIEKKQKLNFTFLIFLPVFKYEELHPLITKTTFEVPGRDGEKILTGSSLGMWSIITSRTYKDVTYQGEGAKLYKVEVKKEDDKILNKVIKQFSAELRKAKTIKQYKDIKGSLIMD